TGFQRRMDELLDCHRCVSEVRGLGYFYALELVTDSETDTPLSDTQRAALEGGLLAALVRDAGLLIRPDDRGATMLVISPPLVADNAVLDDLGTRLNSVLTGIEGWLDKNP
ncbi:MAG: aspartate aminotransferase family protein, partial [Acidimicrobiia bacterium]|nr:aspartate aminotransferase family protein [Acidimicrobiia bacterium]